MSALGLLALAAIASTPPKHVMMVVVDDLGFDDLGFRNGNQIPTVNFNQLALDGIIFDRYYVQPSCSPTRATLMTGRMPVHTGINVWIPTSAYGLGLNESTIADVLNARGFVSHAVGKWHLGFFQTEYTPTFRGFSSFKGYYEGSEDYFQHHTAGGLDWHDEQGLRCGKGCSRNAWEDVGSYSTNLITSRAVAIIGEHDAARPLFIYLAYQAVHEPAECPYSYMQKYGAKIEDGHRRKFAGMLGAADEGLGNVTAALTAKGMLDQTLVVVTTDNGGPTTECSTTGQSNWPLRGSKCSVWEGGTRGTGFVWWAGLSSAVKGTHFAGLAHACDFLPTIVSALGGAPLRLNETLPLDGISLWQALVTGEASPREDVYYGVNQHGGGPAVRDIAGKKLILGGVGGGAGVWSPQQFPNTSVAPSHRAAAPMPQTGPAAAARSAHQPHQQPKNATGPWRPQSGPSPEPPAPALFDVVADPGEHAPMSVPDNQRTVAALQAIVARYSATEVPQKTSDKRCPSYNPTNTSQGKVVVPWCDGQQQARPPALL